MEKDDLQQSGHTFPICSLLQVILWFGHQFRTQPPQPRRRRLINGEQRGPQWWMIPWG